MPNDSITSLIHIIGYMALAMSVFSLVLAAVLALMLKQVRSALKAGLGDPALGKSFVENWQGTPKKLLISAPVGLIIGIIALIS